jgi:hypothetical protein
MKIIIEVELDLEEAMTETGIDKLTDHEASMFEYFVERQLEAYNPDQVISWLELKMNDRLCRLFREGFEIHAERR